MISDKMIAALSDQVTKELWSGYIYLANASYFEEQSLPGFSHWMRIQAQEESCHAMILYNYISEQGGRVALGAIEAPATDWKSPLDVLERGLGHEQLVTSLINKLVDLAIDERDHATNNKLKWFIDEQVEEEANFDAVRAQLARCSEGQVLLLMDKELSARAFALPSPLIGKM